MRTTIFASAFALALVTSQTARADEPAGASASGSASLSLGGSSSASASTSSPEPASDPKAPAKTEGQDTSARSVLGWTGVGLGVAGLTLFIVQMARAGDIRDDRDAAQAKLPAGTNACAMPPTDPNFVTGRTACDADDTAGGVRNLGIVGLVGGLLFATGGVVLLVTDKKGSEGSAPEKKEEPKASWRLTPVLGGTNGFVASGSF